MCECERVCVCGTDLKKVDGMKGAADERLQHTIGRGRDSNAIRASSDHHVGIRGGDVQRDVIRGVRAEKPVFKGAVLGGFL